ncbi:hypothetical protein YC2023_033566 [Brassica napus]
MSISRVPRVGYFSTREDMSSTRCQVGDGNLCFGVVLIIEDGWITKTHVVSQKTPENTLNRRWFNVFGLPKLTSQVRDENLCFGGVLIFEDGWITKTHVVSRKTPENTLNRRWFNVFGLPKLTWFRQIHHIKPTLVQSVFRRVGYFSTREDMSSTRCQVGDGNLCFGGVLIIEDGWITKTHVVSRKTPENTFNRRWFNVFGLPKLTWFSEIHHRVGDFSTREDMSSREEVRLEMELSAMLPKLTWFSEIHQRTRKPNAGSMSISRVPRELGISQLART